jgi:hypothetical protein
MQSQAPDELDEPVILVDDAEDDETDAELDDDEHVDAGARTNVRKNIDRFGTPPLLLCPWGKNPLVELDRVSTHEPSDGPHSSPGAGSEIAGSTAT